MNLIAAQMGVAKITAAVANRLCRIVIAGVLVIGVTKASIAQCSYTYNSLEGRVAVAAHCYHGSIVGFKRKVIVPRNGTRPGTSSTIPDGVVRYVLTVDIKTALKGPSKKTVDLVAETSDYDKRYEQWAKRKSTFLFFVVKPEIAYGRKPLDHIWPSAWTYLRLDQPAAGEKSYRTIAPPIFANDGTVLRDPKIILKRARLFAKRHPKNLKVHTFTIPRTMAERCSASCDANFFVVPVEPQLEATAKAMLFTPERFLAKNTKLDSLSRYLLRVAGVGALRHFQSDENKKLLKSLLTDKTSSVSNYDFGKYKGKKVRQYPIRKSAWETLKSWRVSVAKPVIQEVISGD